MNVIPAARFNMDIPAAFGITREPRFRNSCPLSRSKHLLPDEHNCLGSVDQNVVCRSGPAASCRYSKILGSPGDLKLIPPNSVPQHLSKVYSIAWSIGNRNIKARRNAKWRCDAIVRHIDDNRLIILVKILDGVSRRGRYQTLP